MTEKIAAAEAAYRNLNVARLALARAIMALDACVNLADTTITHEEARGCFVLDGISDTQAGVAHAVMQSAEAQYFAAHEDYRDALHEALPLRTKAETEAKQ
jgi:hypothetical protein